jgi:hypothetical protein
MDILGNAFSINMLKGGAIIRFEPMTEDQFISQLKRGDFVSAVGHPATASFLSQRLGFDVPFNRIDVAIEPGMFLYVAQAKGRLPEGKVLSEEEMQAVEVQYWLVSQEQ